VTLRAKAPLGDDALLAWYYERLRSRLRFFDLEDRLLCERIALLIPRLDEDG